MIGGWNCDQREARGTRTEERLVVEAAASPKLASRLDVDSATAAAQLQNSLGGAFVHLKTARREGWRQASACCICGWLVSVRRPSDACLVPLDEVLG